jgi:NDP-sugar pyrophosphorylase family protein
MGTGGGYRYAADADQATVVFNGDILTDVDISKIIDFHKAKAADATIVLTPVENPSAYGLVETEADGRVLRFLEKPSADQLSSLTTNMINAGIYVLEPKILDLIPKDENRSFEYDVFPTILERKMPFFAYQLDGDYWRDIGTCASYLDAHTDFLAGRIKGFEITGDRISEIATAASIDRRSILGEDCTVKPGAVITNSVIGPGVVIEEKAVVRDSVIWSHSRISAAAEVRGAIIGRGSHIGRSVVVGEGSVLGDKTSLPDYSRV